jgi:hypothetical protein
MFAVVGLTLEDVSSGAPPQVRLAEALQKRKKLGKSRTQSTKRIIVYGSDGSDTQGLLARAKYKEHGSFVVFMYFSEGAVGLCKEFKIPLRIVDHVDERGLPPKKIIILEDPSLTAFSSR